MIKIRAVRENPRICSEIINRLLGYLSLAALILLPLSLLRMLESGWQPVMGLHLVLSLALWGVWSRRTVLSLLWRFGYIVLMLDLIAVGAIIHNDSMIHGSPFFILAVVVVGTYFSRGMVLAHLFLHAAIQLSYLLYTDSYSLHLMLAVAGAVAVSAATVFMVVSLLDRLTERTERLQEAMRQLNDAQSLGKMGSWVLDLQGNELQWTDEIYNIFGVDKRRFGASYEAFLETVHPDDRERVHQVYRDSVENRTASLVQYEMALKRGRHSNVKRP